MPSSPEPPTAQRILDAIDDAVAVVDHEGRIVETNAAWDRFGEANGLEDVDHIGEDYLAVARSAHDGTGEAAAEGIEAVLGGQREQFRLEYPCHGPNEERFFEMQVVALGGDGSRFAVVSHRNITERRLAERERERLTQQLTGQQALLDEVTRALPQVLWLVDAEVEEVLFASPGAGAFWGLPAERVRTDPFAWLDLVHPDDEVTLLTRLEADISTLVEDPDAIPEDEFRIHHGETGEERWIRIQGVPVHDEGRLTAIAGICEDITDRKLREEERERLRRIVDASPEGIGIAEPDGGVLYLNDRFRSLMGFQDDVEIEELTFEAFHPPGTLEALRSTWIPEAIEQGSWRGESTLVDSSGERIPVLQTITAHEDELGEVTHLSTIVRDIRPLKAAEQALRESEQQFRELAEHVDAVFWLNDASFEETLYISPAYEEVWGRSRDELYERPEAFVEAIHPEDRARVVEALDHVAEGGYDVEYRVLQPDGEVRWVHDRGFPIRGTDGEVQRFAGLAVDITAQRARADERAQQARTAARAAELEQIVFATSHTLRTKVRQVASFSQLLERLHGDELDDDGREFLEQVVSGTRELDALHQALREYAEITKEMSPSQRVDLDAILDRALEAVGGSLAEIDARVERSALGAVEGDPKQLAALFEELLDNAIRFRSKAPLSIEIAGEPAGEMRRIRVTDNGQGFEARYGDRIFGIFQQLDADGSNGGVGMGLTICRRIVENHGGMIRAEGRPGEGASVTFTLPAADDA